MSFTIDTTKVVKLASDLDEAGGTFQLYINRALKNSANIVMQEEMKEAPRGVTQKLAKSVQQIVTEVAAIISPTADHAIYVNNGTKPHMPPIDAITPWAESKGLNPWAVAMSIKKKGTQANPFVDRTFKATKGEVIAEFAVATKLIAGALYGKAEA